MEPAALAPAPSAPDDRPARSGLPDDPGPAASPLVALVTLEAEVRAARTAAELHFLIANRTRALVGYRQAVVLAGARARALRVAAISDVPNVDATGPYVAWLERLARRVVDAGGALDVHAIEAPADGHEQRDWAELGAPHVLWVPLVAPGHGLQGALCLAGTRPFPPAAMTVLAHVAVTFGHALAALRPRGLLSAGDGRPVGRRLGVLATVLAGLVLAVVPVRLSVLAPAEVVARDPSVIASPLDGAVKRILVESNEVVEQGAPLLELEDSDLASRRAVAERTLAVAQAALHKTRQESFVDARQKGRLAELEAEVDLRRAELDYARARLEKAVVRAPERGVAIVGDRSQWAGRPVVVGERVMLVADPASVRLQLLLPVKDAVALELGSPVKVFLDVDPLHAVDAVVERAAYQPEPTPEGTLAYRLYAGFPPGAAAQRIGLRGTAKVYGEQVSLFYFVFRRPLTALRQWLGF